MVPGGISKASHPPPSRTDFGCHFFCGPQVVALLSVPSSFVAFYDEHKQSQRRRPNRCVGRGTCRAVLCRSLSKALSLLLVQSMSVSLRPHTAPFLPSLLCGKTMPARSKMWGESWFDHSVPDILIWSDGRMLGLERAQGRSSSVYFLLCGGIKHASVSWLLLD